MQKQKLAADFADHADQTNTQPQRAQRSTGETMQAADFAEYADLENKGRRFGRLPLLPIWGFSYLVAIAGSRWDWKISRRLLISSQFARFHQAARYSGRRLLYFK
jgi:hypothetical protein